MPRFIPSFARRVLVLGASLCLLAPAWALDPPSGAPILTISGNVGAKNQAGTAVFDLTMLEALPQRSFVTNTPWDKQPTKFTGPLLRDVLAAVGAKGSKITAVALNDYKTEIPLDDATRHDVIVARLMNNRPMPVREKGPLFIVYPFDTKAELRSELYYNRAAWQLNALRIR